MKESIFILFALAAFVFVVDCGVAAPQVADIKINPRVKFQKMTGWEATVQAGQDYSPAFEKYKEQLYREVVNDLGINRLRLEVRSGAENPKDYFSLFASKQITEQEWLKNAYEVINDNDDPFTLNAEGFQFSEIDSNIKGVVIPIRELLAKRGEKLFLNLTFVDFDGKKRGNSNIRHNNNPEEYAELITAVFKHMDDRFGFVPDAVEVILEPDNKTGWTGTDIANAIVATSKRLKRNNFEPGFIAPSTVNAANAPVYFDEIAKNPVALNYLSEFSYHRYTGASDAVLRRITERARKYGKKTGMLEYIGADFETLHSDLKAGNVSSWEQYTLAFPNQPDNGAQYFMIDDRKPGDPSVTLAARSKFLRQYFRYVRMGAQRIGAESSNLNFDPVAFINRDEDFVVIIKAGVAGEVSVHGLPKGDYGVIYTTLAASGIESGPQTIESGKTLKATIPAPGVITIYGKNLPAKSAD